MWGWLSKRMNRAQYWLLLGAMTIIYVTLQFVPGGDRVPFSGWLLLAICVPRLHDLGLSGWWSAPPLAVVGLFGLAYALNQDSVIFLLAVTVVFLVSVALLIWLGAVPGQRDPNRFGNPPAAGLRFGKTVSPTDTTAAQFE
jgi:uncharacterized membrane protein YhaH (DUF805 family)